MMTLRSGEFWVANILFTDGSAGKKRPVLVLWLDGQDVVVAAVTSAAPRSSTDVLLADWRNSGLRVPSTVRLSRLDSLEQALLLTKLGRLSSADAQTLQKTWTTHIQLRF